MELDVDDVTQGELEEDSRSTPSFGLENSSAASAALSYTGSNEPK